MSIKSFLHRKKKTEPAGTPEAQETEASSLPSDLASKTRFDFSHVGEKMTPKKLMIVGGGFLFLVFLIHTAVSGWQAHKKFLEEKERLQLAMKPKTVVVKKHFGRRLPPVDVSADHFYIAMSKLSEFSKIRVHFLSGVSDPSKRLQSRDASGVGEWTTPLTLIPGVYTGKVRIMFSGPITEVGIFLPEVQELFLENNGIMEHVEFYKNTGGQSKGAGLPHLIVEGTFYGDGVATAPLPPVGGVPQMPKATVRNF